MKNGIRPLIVGNWKMNPPTVANAEKLGKSLKKSLENTPDIDIVLCPPFVYLDMVQKILGSTKNILLGVQDIFFEHKGAYTGQISIPMIECFGVTYAILGHSERRALGESDDMVNQKLLAVLKAGLTGIVCIGETQRDHNAHYLSHIESQIHKACANIQKNKLDRMVIAYEPIWAIGTGNNATADDVHEMTIFIRKILSDMYGRNFAYKIRILYGGSVNEKNASVLYTRGVIDGFLVGGASLDANTFAQIVTTVSKTRI